MKLSQDNIKTMIFAILCICFIFYLVLGIYSYRRDRKSKVNVIFLTLCVSASIWALGYAFMLISPNIKIANSWKIFSALGWCFFDAIWVSFAFSLRDKKEKSSGLKIQFLIYTTSIIFLINNISYDPTKVISNETYGFVDNLYGTTTIGIIFNIYITVLLLAGFLILYIQMRNSRKNRVRKQIKTILITSLISFSLGAVTDMILPALGVVLFPFAIITISIGMGGMWYAINIQKMMSINYELVSEYIFEAVNEPIFILDEDFLVKNCNKAALNISGYNEKILKQKSLHSIINFRDFNFNTIMQVENVTNIEVDLYRKNKEGIVCELSATVICDEYKDILGILILLHDVSERKSIAEIQKKYTLKLEESNEILKNEIADRLLAEEKIRHLIYYDALTELFNRKKMIEVVEELLDDKNEKFAVLFIDLDKFKNINDDYGHQAGDYVLKIVAERLKSIVKLTDTISRIGGDEFIIILRSLKATANAENTAIAVLEAVSTAFTYKGNQLFIGASIGISIYPEHGNDSDTLIKKADLAMYEVKCKGGYGYVIYSSEMKEDLYKLGKLPQSND